MKNTIFLIGMLLMIANLSCNQDENNLQKVLLRSKKFYFSKRDSNPWVTYKYDYDTDNRLVKINQYRKETDYLFAYETFQYNNEDYLEVSLVYYYANDLTGWVLSDSTSNKYENGLLLFSQTFFPPPNSYAILYRYEYQNQLIVKKSRFDNQEFQYCILYDYSNGICAKETRFSDSGLTSINSYTIHHSENGLRIRSDIYNSQNQVIQIVTYKYDFNGNLILEVSEKIDFTVVAPLEYVYRYEYF